jgi:hypothetical protein
MAQLDDEHLHTIVDRIFEKYDKNRSYSLELDEIRLVL